MLIYAYICKIFCEFNAMIISCNKWGMSNLTLENHLIKWIELKLFTIHLKENDMYVLCGKCNVPCLYCYDRKTSMSKVNHNIIYMYILFYIIREQDELKQRLVLQDTENWQQERALHDGSKPDSLKYIGGVDISFVKGDNVNACAALIIVNFPELEVVEKFSLSII